MNNPPIEPEELRSYFYWLGITFHTCHQLEFGVKTVLVTMADMGFGGFDLNETIAIIEDEKRKTLGQAIEFLRKRVTMSDGWTQSLAAGLEARNRFVHRFLSEVDERVANPVTRPGVIAEVQEIRRSILKADKTVQEILEALYGQAGLSWQDLRAQWAEEVRALNKPATSEPPQSNETG